MQAAKVLVSRLATFVVSLLVASLAIFWVTNSLPGDVAQVLLGANATEGEAAALRERLGLDRNWWVRYGEWMSGLVRGDFGESWINGAPVGAQIADKLAVTGSLVVGGMLLAILIAVPVGSFAAVRRRHWSGFVASAASQIGLSIPAFWAGILLALLFAVRLRWLPAGGYVPFSQSPALWAEHLVLPVVSIGVVQAAVLSRFVRSSVIEVLEEDYFRTARAVGWTRLAALLRHGVRNAALSVITVLGLQLATLLVGAIVIEQVFALNGLGSLLLIAVGQRDLVIVQGIVLVLVFCVLAINFVVDVSYRLIDPRLRNRGADE